MGIKSRSIVIFLNDAGYLSNRDVLYENVFRKIIDDPFLGIGIGGDRALLNGAYVHNIFLEIIANYGLFIGVSIISMMIFLIIKNILTKNTLKCNLVIIWLSFGFVPLFVSSSYLMDFKFWIFLGVLLNKNFLKSFAG